MKNEDAQLRNLDKHSIFQAGSFAKWRQRVVTSVTTFAHRITGQRLRLNWIGHASKNTKNASRVPYSLWFLRSSEVVEPLSSKKITPVTGMVSQRTGKLIRSDLPISEVYSQVKTSSGIPVPDFWDFLLTPTRAFESMPMPTKRLLERVTFHEDGASALVATAAFCQILQELPGGHDILEKCKEKRDDYHAQILLYRELQKTVERGTDLIFMPDIQDTLLHDPGALMIRVGSWLGGRMPVSVSCHTFLHVLGYCIGFSYGKLMMGAHVHLRNATWAAVIEITFPVPLNLDSPASQAIQTIGDTLRQSQFHFQVVGAWRNRTEKLFIAVLGGCVLAALRSMGSMSSTWVVLVAAAGANLRPIPGHTPAIWSLPFNRRIRMKARSKAPQGAETNLKRISNLASLQQAVCENAALQSIIGILSIPITGATLVASYINGGISIGFRPANISHMDWALFSLNFCSATIILVCAKKHGPSEVWHGRLLMVLAMLNLGSKSLWSKAGFLATSNPTWMPSAGIWLASVFLSCLGVFGTLPEDTSCFCLLWPCVWGYELGGSLFGILTALWRFMVSRDLAPDL